MIALQNIIRFIILVIIQVFLLDNIQILGYINPMIYILFILSLPIRMSRIPLLLLGFLLGITIDIFNNTPGLHTSAVLLIAFLRPPIVKMFVEIEEITKETPSFRTFGVPGYLKFTIVLVLIHHFVLFFVESFSFLNLSLLIPKILLSSLVSIVLILLIQSFNRK